MSEPTDGTPRVVVFTCNWNAHESFQAAGRQRLRLPPGVRSLHVDCLGRVGASLILKAFEKGADGVVLVGCLSSSEEGLPEECHYEFGSRRAAELFEQVRPLAAALGFGDEQLAFYQIQAGQPEVLIGAICAFVARLAASGQPGALSPHPKEGPRLPQETGIGSNTQDTRS